MNYLIFLSRWKLCMYNLFSWHSAARRFFHNHSIRINHGGWQGLSRWTTDKQRLLRPGQADCYTCLAFFWIFIFCNFLSLYCIPTRRISLISNQWPKQEGRKHILLLINYVPVFRKLTRLFIIWYLHFLHGFYVYFISNLNVEIKLSGHQTFYFRRT